MSEEQQDRERQTAELEKRLGGKIEDSRGVTILVAGKPNFFRGATWITDEPYGLYVLISDANTRGIDRLVHASWVEGRG